MLNFNVKLVQENFRRPMLEGERAIILDFKVIQQPSMQKISTKVGCLMLKTIPKPVNSKTTFKIVTKQVF